MRVSPIFVCSAIVVIVSALIAGCITGIKSVKPDADKARPADAKPPSAAKDVLAPRQGQGEIAKADKSPAAGSERYSPPPSPSRDDSAAGTAIDLRTKEEVNQAGLKFAENVSGVKHIKTCYSKLYGGWYLFLYIQTGKQISLQQYSWNSKTKEWEVIYHLKNLEPGKLDGHLKGEVDDEKCFVLK